MCKVDDLIEEYGLTAPGSEYDSIDDYLAQRWTGSDGRTPEGYKKLTDWFNKRVLKAIYEEHGRSTVSIHLDREYNVIVNEDNIQRTELAADLEGDGMDIDELKRTLVSHGTIRNHFKNCLEVEKDTQAATKSSSNPREKAIASAKRMATSKTEGILPDLAANGIVPHADEAVVDIEIRLKCPICDTRVPIEDAIQRGYVCKEHMSDTKITDSPENPTTDSSDNTESDGGTPQEQQSKSRPNCNTSSKSLFSICVLTQALELVSEQSPNLIDGITYTV